MQYAVEDGHVPVGRNHIDMVRLDLHPVFDLDDFHGGRALEQLRHYPLVCRIKVLNDDKGHPASSGYTF